MHFKKKATTIKNKIHKSDIHQSFPSAKSLPEKFWKISSSGGKKRKNMLFSLYVERMTKTRLKKKWVQKITKHYLKYFSSSFLTVYG